MKLNDKVYDVMKWVVVLLLPALHILYKGLAETWGLPYPEQIPDTIVYVQMFLGTILGISTAQYNKNK